MCRSMFIAMLCDRKKVEILRYWNKHKHRDQWNKVKSPEINHSIYYN